MEKVYVNQFLDSEEPNRVDYSQIYLTRHDCKELIEECLYVYEHLTFYNDDIDDLEIKNVIVKNVVDNYKKQLEEDDSESFDYYYENALDFVYDILDECGELIKIVEFTNFRY